MSLNNKILNTPTPLSICSGEYVEEGEDQIRVEKKRKISIKGESS